MLFYSVRPLVVLFNASKGDSILEYAAGEWLHLVVVVAVVLVRVRFVKRALLLERKHALPVLDDGLQVRVGVDDAAHLSIFV